MKTLYAAGAAAVALALYAAPAAAQQVPTQQWCAIDSAEGDVESCSYSSLQQCLLAFSQSGLCYENALALPVKIARPKKARTRNS
jgi:hypothetical protein